MCQQPEAVDNYTFQNIKLYSLGHHRPSPQNDRYDGQQSPIRLPSMHISQRKEMQFWFLGQF